MKKLGSATLPLILFLLMLLSGCAQPPPPPPPPPPADTVHTVVISGETLGVISSWYTGSWKNWSAIRKANPKLKTTKLKVGDQIIIPVGLVVNPVQATKKDIQNIWKKNKKLKEKREAKSAASALKSKDTSPDVGSTTKTPVEVTPKAHEPSTTSPTAMSEQTPSNTSANSSGVDLDIPSSAPTASPPTAAAPQIAREVPEAVATVASPADLHPATTPSSAERTRDDLIDEILNK